MSREHVRGAAALAVALAVHLSATYVLRRRVPPPPPTTTLPDDVVVEVVTEPTPPSPETPEEQAQAPAPPRIGLAAASSFGRGSPATRSTEAVDLEPSGDQAPAPPSSSAPAWTFRATVPDIHPRSRDFAAWPAGRAAADAPAPASTSGGVVEALDAADVERGLGRGGPVRTAIDLAARGDGPVRGNATFSVTLFSDGRIDVQVASGQADWSRLVPGIREALAAAKIRMPPKGRGLNVVVAVDASVRYPDGYAPPDKTEVDLHGSIGGAKPTDPVSMGAPVVSLGVRGRRCSANVAVTVGGVGAGAGCSAGVPARVVATRIVSEQRF